MSTVYEYGWELFAFTRDQKIITEGFVLIYLLSLCFIFWLSLKFTEKWNIWFFPVLVIAILCGIGVVCATNTVNYNGDIIMDFDADFFFYVMLPPIVFESGFQLNYRLFIANLLAITTFANIGTIFCTLATGYGLFYLGLAGVSYELSIMECLAFGALISATDPVTTLSIFKELQVDPILIAIALSVSVVDDAISNIMFYTFNLFVGIEFEPSYAVITIVNFFLTSFVGSIVIGYLLGVGFVAIIKWNPELLRPRVFFSLIISLTYISYLAASVVQLSGIISCLVTSISFKRYFELLHGTSRFEETSNFVETLSYFSEFAVFFSMGMSFTEDFYSSDYDYAFIAWSILVIFLSRMVQVYLLSFLLNLINGHDICKYHDNGLVSNSSSGDEGDEHYSDRNSADSDSRDRPATSQPHVRGSLSASDTDEITPLFIPKRKSFNTAATLDKEQDDEDRDYKARNNLNNFNGNNNNSYNGNNNNSYNSSSTDLMGSQWHSTGAALRRGSKQVSSHSSECDEPTGGLIQTFPSSYLRYVGRSPQVLSMNSQHMLLFSGLRGPLAYAQSEEISNVLGNSAMICNTTKVIVVFTVLIHGGLTQSFLKWMNIATQVDMKKVDAVQAQMDAQQKAMGLEAELSVFESLEKHVADYFDTSLDSNDHQVDDSYDI